MKRVLNHFGRLLILLVFLGAAWLLYDRLKEYTFQDIRDAIARISAWQIIVASLLTVANYLILVGYDWFAVRWVKAGDLSLRKIALASFTGYAFSYNFGATLFGTSIRYRLYSAWNVPLVKIVELLVILGLTFWFGVFTLAGVVFVVAPFPVPAKIPIPGQATDLSLPFDNTFWVGVVLLLIALGYVALSALHRKPFHFFRWHIPLPPLKLTLYQIVIACGDLLVAAAVLYTLLPPVEGGYLRVVAVFMLAFVAAVLTHVPGGYGVFEFMILEFLPKENAPAVFAAMLVFRVIYYWVPLVIAAAMLAGNELTIRSNGTEKPRQSPLSPGNGSELSGD
jgi:phosphatidylglycerol lysyltransferase